MNMLEYKKPMVQEIKFDNLTHLLAGSVRNDDKTIINGSPTYGDNEVGNGDDAAAKENSFLDWDE